jgi:hypothetical protein
VLGEDFAGFLVRDGWAVYRRFAQAVHQTCLAHLLRRCREMIEVAPPGGTTAQFSQAVQEILQRALALRHRRDQAEISEEGLAVARSVCWLLADNEITPLGLPSLACSALHGRSRWRSASPIDRRLTDALSAAGFHTQRLVPAVRAAFIRLSGNLRFAEVERVKDEGHEQKET